MKLKEHPLPNFFPILGSQGVPMGAPKEPNEGPKIAKVAQYATQMTPQCDPLSYFWIFLVNKIIKIWFFRILKFLREFPFQMRHWIPLMGKKRATWLPFCRSEAILDAWPEAACCSFYNWRNMMHIMAQKNRPPPCYKITTLFGPPIPCTLSKILYTDTFEKYVGEHTRLMTHF